MSPVYDPVVTSKIPSGKPPVPPKKPDLLNKVPLTPNTKVEHPEWMSFSEKKRHFEKANSVTTSPNSVTTNTITTSKSEEIFNTPEMKSKENVNETNSYTKTEKVVYLTQRELDQLREEEAKKMSKYSEEQIRQMYHGGGDDEDELDDLNGGATILNEKSFETLSTDGAGGQQRKIFRTAKAEKRYLEKMSALGIDVQSEAYANLTPAQQRALEAEKRKEWRQARLKSLEDDAMRSMISARNLDNFEKQSSTIITHEELLEDEADGSNWNHASPLLIPDIIYF